MDYTKHTITEGLATIQTSGKVFYNPVQEFNRDLSIAVLRTYAESNEIEDGLSILEALSATGLRSIRYAKEVQNVKQVIANDLSSKAVDDIRVNVKSNEVEHIVHVSKSDATTLMYNRRAKQDRFHVIDLDPYGCPSTFLDGAVQAVCDSGLLLVTATDMAVLAGNSPETCYSKYGAISLRIKACHEMAVRILLQCIESHANRYGRYVKPILSISADFYIRVFVQIFTSPIKCKYTLSKLSHVFHCSQCSDFRLWPLGVVHQKNDKPKFALPSTAQMHSTLCDNCNSPLFMGGPIWSGPLHCSDFVALLRANSTYAKGLNTEKRIDGILAVISEELCDSPLYYTLDCLCGVMRCEMPKMVEFRSALLNAGYHVSYTHMNKNGIKTNAPSHVVWDIMREWIKLHPIHRKHLENHKSITHIIASKRQTCTDISFALNTRANPESKKMGLLRFQQNPEPHWGPGTRATAMLRAHNLEDKTNEIPDENKGRKRKHSD